MRVIHVVFLVALVLYLYVTERFVSGNGSQVSPQFLYAMTAMAGFDLMIAVYFRRAKLRPALEKLQRDVNDAEALKQWRSATIICMVLTLSVALYGLALRFIGASRQTSWAFYFAAFVVLILWRPKLELPAEIPGPPENQ